MTSKPINARRCFGRVANLRRCQREGKWRLFCHDHKYQPVWVIFAFFFTVVAAIPDLKTFFADLLNPAEDTEDSFSQDSIPPLKKITEEKIEYYRDIEKIEKATSDTIWSSLNKRLVGEHLGDEVKIYNIGIRKNVDYFVHFQEFTKTKFHQAKLLIVRDRSKANLDPFEMLIPHTVGEAKYEGVLDGFESAIITRSVEGSGGFFNIRILMWDGQGYRDLMLGDYPSEDSGPMAFPDAVLTLADLDGDGRMEVIVKLGCKALRRKTMLFLTLNKEYPTVYEEVPSTNKALNQRFEKALRAVKDNAILKDLDDCS